MSDMFCFQCQQTAGGSGCVRTGVCGKQPTTAHLQDILVCRLIRLAEVCEQKSEHPREVTPLLADGGFTPLTNVNFDDGAIRAFTVRVEDALRSHGGDVREENPSWLWRGETDLVSLRSTLLFGLKGMAAYAHHAMRLGCEDETVSAWFCKGLSALAQEHSVAEWLALITEFGEVNFKCMALLDRANTSAFGDPVPTRVHTDIQKGPFIVVSGHGLIQLRKEGTDEILNYEVSGDKIQSVIMLPGYTHNIINLSETENLVTVMYCNEIFDPNKPDTYFDKVEK